MLLFEFMDVINCKINLFFLILTCTVLLNTNWLN